MEKIIFFDFNILNIDDLQELKSIKLQDFDLINVNSSNLKSGFLRYQKITWRLKIDNPDPFTYILSKKERHKIRRLLKGADFQVMIVEPLTENIFRSWFTIYQQMIGSKQRGKLFIGQDWLKKKEQEKKFTAGIFVYQRGILKGGSLIIELKKEACLSIAYSAFARESGDYHSFRSLVEYTFLKYGIENGYRKLGHGKDTNLYGMHLTTGLFEFKSRYGYKPQSFSRLPLVTTFFINKEKFFGEILFLYFNQGKQELMLLSDKDEAEILPQRFTHAGLKLNTSKLSLIIASHREFLRGGL